MIPDGALKWRRRGGEIVALRRLDGFLACPDCNGLVGGCGRDHCGDGFLTCTIDPACGQPACTTADNGTLLACRQHMIDDAGITVELPAYETMAMVQDGRLR